MKISVIITTYNRPEYLKKVLEAYLRQTRLPDEIVVADDGSGPETKAVVDAFKAKAPFSVIHAWQEHRGFRVAVVRNLGTKASTGDYIIYTDGDNVPSRHFIKDHTMLARPGLFITGKRVMVQEKAVREFTGNEGFWKLLWMWIKGDLKKVAFYKLFHFPRFPINSRGGGGYNCGVFRDDVYKINGWNEAFAGCGAEDHDFDIRLRRSGLRTWTASFSALVFHLNHPPHIREKGSAPEGGLLELSHNGPVFIPDGLVKVADKEKAGSGGQRG